MQLFMCKDIMKIMFAPDNIYIYKTFLFLDISTKNQNLKGQSDLKKKKKYGQIWLLQTLLPGLPTMMYGQIWLLQTLLPGLPTMMYGQIWLHSLLKGTCHPRTEIVPTLFFKFHVVIWRSLPNIAVL